MINYPKREAVNRIKNEFPSGARVELIKMDDAQAPAIGTHGTVIAVDDTGTIHVAWDSGSTLGVILGEDIARRIADDKR